MGKPYKLESGKWKVDLRRKGHRRATRVFASATEATRWVRSLEHQIDARKHSDDRAISGLLLQDLIDLYLAEQPDARKNKRNAILMVREKLGLLPVAAITDHTFVRYALDRQVSPVTWGIDLAYMALLWKYATRVWKMPLKGNPAAEARETLTLMGEGGRSNRRNRRPTEDELDRLKDHFRSKVRQQIPMWNVIDFAVASAMRCGEITRLRWADLDGATILIRQRKHPTLKAANDQRVPLLPAALAAIDLQPRGELIFPYKEHSISTVFSRATEVLGIPDLTFHDLRHEGISRLFEAGYGLHEVAVFSGHRSWDSLSRYTHLDPAALAVKFSRSTPASEPPASGDEPRPGCPDPAPARSLGSP